MSVGSYEEHVERYKREDFVDETYNPYDPPFPTWASHTALEAREILKDAFRRVGELVAFEIDKWGGQEWKVYKEIDPSPQWRELRQRVRSNTSWTLEPENDGKPRDALPIPIGTSYYQKDYTRREHRCVARCFRWVHSRGGRYEDRCLRRAVEWADEQGFCAYHWERLELSVRIKLTQEYQDLRKKISRREEDSWRRLGELNVQDLADWLVLPPDYIRQLCRDEEIPHIRSNGYRFIPEEIVAWVYGAKVTAKYPDRIELVPSGKPSFSDWSSYWQQLHITGGSNGYRATAA